MKKLLCSIAAILCVLFLLDRAGGMIMRETYQYSKDIWSYKINYIVNQADEDVILMGTSRCNNHYVPAIIADTLGLTVYNAGISSTKNIYSHYICLCHLLAHHTPQVVCLELSSADFVKEDNAFSSTTFFAPFFGRCAQADSVFRDSGRFRAFRLSHLYRFNGRSLQTIAGLILDWQKDDEQGYQPIPRPDFLPDSLGREVLSSEIDSLKLHYLNQFIALCREKDITTVLMISPRYTLVCPEFYATLKEVARQNEVPLLDYHTIGLYHEHPEYFRDNDHLWDEGARHYSAVFAGDLKKLSSMRKYFMHCSGQ